MDEVVEKNAIRERVRAIAGGRGLRRNDLAARLGVGLRRLWRINPDANDLKTRRYIADRISGMIDETPDKTGEGWVAKAGRISFNISPLIGDQVLGYDARRKYLDEPRRTREGLGEPVGGYRSYSQIRADSKIVYDHIANVIWAEWQKEFPGESFPRNLPSAIADDQIEAEADLDATGPGDSLDEAPVAPPANTATETQFAPPRRRRLRSKPTYLAAAILGVLVITAGALVLTHPWQSSGATITNPLAMTVVSLHSKEDGYSVAFPVSAASAASQFETTYQAGATSLQPTLNRALQDGGYAVGDELVGVQVETQSNDPVTITDVHPTQIVSGQVATGVLLDDPGGSGPNVNPNSMGFDLDRPNPDARQIETNGSLGQPFFASTRPVVAHGTPTPINLDFFGHGASYAFKIEVDYEVDGQQGSEIVTATPGGQPFEAKVTGTLCDVLPNATPAAQAQFNTLTYGRILEAQTGPNGTRVMSQLSTDDFINGNCS